jgi:hypothetical protein
MRFHWKTMFMISLVLALALPAVAPAAAQEEPPAGEILPCEGEGVSGTVVAVDEETGLVTVYTGGGLLCTVTLDSDYDHPIVDLLGTFFGDMSAGDLAPALDRAQGCAVYDEVGAAWTWADCDAEGAVPVTVVGDNEGSTFTALTEEGEVVTVSVEDTEIAGGLSEALGELAVEWELGEDGSVVQPGGEIAAYHEEGLGFGVLVKLYAIAAKSQEGCGDDAEDVIEPCEVTVEELVAALQSGMGMGELFKEYGRPALLGVGHVRKGSGPPDHAGPKDRPGDAGDDADDDVDDDVDEGEGTGPLNQAGPSQHTGRPENAGPPDHAGPKDRTDRPGRHQGHDK